MVSVVRRGRQTGIVDCQSLLRVIRIQITFPDKRRQFVAEADLCNIYRHSQVVWRTQPNLQR